jgi:hypothetical protein
VSGEYIILHGWMFCSFYMVRFLAHKNMLSYTYYLLWFPVWSYGATKELRKSSG